MRRAIVLGVLLAALAGWLAVDQWSGGQADWATVQQQIRTEFPAVGQLSVESLDAWLGSGERLPLLLDVRQEAEYRVSHLRGAVRVEPGDPPPAWLDEVDQDTPIVVYCSVGYRSADLAEELIESGYARVVNLEGSIFEWANKGYPVVRDGLEVHQVHPYDEHWGTLLAPELHAYPVE